MAQHDLIFFEKRSTPKVVSRGQKFVAPEAYGKQTKRRPATPSEEMIIARGDWVRVDENGVKGGQPGYKKTKMAGREHLVHKASIEESNMSNEYTSPIEALMNLRSEDDLTHFGIKGMKWGHRKATGSGSSSKSGKSGPGRAQRWADGVHARSRAKGEAKAREVLLKHGKEPTKSAIKRQVSKDLDRKLKRDGIVGAGAATLVAAGSAAVAYAFRNA